MDYEKKISDYRMRRQQRLDSVEQDGGDGSGNWGHLGRPGEWGGSQPGGGNAYRMKKDRPSKRGSNFFSRAQLVNGKRDWKTGKRIKDGLAQKLAKAEADDDMFRIRKIQRTLRDMVGGEVGNEKGALGRKTAWNMKIYNDFIKNNKFKSESQRKQAFSLANSVHSVKTASSTASRDILADKERGKEVSMRKHTHGRTTEEERARTYKNKKW